MKNITIPLVEARDERHGWSVQIDQCEDHRYEYLLIEQLPQAGFRAYSCGSLRFPEPFLAIVFALQDMKCRRRAQLQL